MNKIQVKDNKIISSIPLLQNENTITLNDIDVAIIYENSSVNYCFNITGCVNVFEYYKNSTSSNTYNVSSNSCFTLNRFSNNCSVDTNINLDTKAIFKSKYSCLNKDDNHYFINVNHNGEESVGKILNYGLNVTKSKLDFIINSHILKESINSCTSQDNKIILLSDNNSSIKPNLLIDNNEISASHSAYLGYFKDKELFYLKSRGICEKECIKLLSKAFLTSNMDLDKEYLDIILNDLECIGGESDE